jgi:hypothetical protein
MRIILSTPNWGSCTHSDQAGTLPLSFTIETTGQHIRIPGIPVLFLFAERRHWQREGREVMAQEESGEELHIRLRSETDPGDAPSMLTS